VLDDLDVTVGQVLVRCLVEVGQLLGDLDSALPASFATALTWFR